MLWRAGGVSFPTVPRASQSGHRRPSCRPVGQAGQRGPVTVEGRSGLLLAYWLITRAPFAGSARGFLLWRAGGVSSPAVPRPSRSGHRRPGCRRVGQVALNGPGALARVVSWTSYFFPDCPGQVLSPGTLLESLALKLTEIEIIFFSSRPKAKINYERSMNPPVSSPLHHRWQHRPENDLFRFS